MNPTPIPSTSSLSQSATTARPPFNFKTPSTPFPFKTPNKFSSSYSCELSFWQQSTTSTPANSISSWPPSPANIKAVVPASTTTTMTTTTIITTTETFTGLNWSPASIALTTHPFSSTPASTAAQFRLLPKNEQRAIIQSADYLLALAAGDSRAPAVPDDAAVPKPQKRKAAAEATERAAKRTKIARVTRGNEPAAQEKDYSLNATGELLRKARNAELMREVRNDYAIKRLKRRIRRRKRAARWGAVKGRVRWNGEVYDL